VGFVLGPLFGAPLVAGGIGTYLVDLLFENVDAYVALVGGVVLILIMLSQPNGMAMANIEVARKLGGLWRGRSKSQKVPETAPLVAVERRTVTPATLEANGITVRFGGVTAVSDVSVRVEPGKVVGVIGPNGAGKTTLIDVITGFVSPVAGTVMLNGKSIDHLSVSARARKGIGRSFQALELFEDVTVRDNLRAASDPRDRLAMLTNLVWPQNTPLPAAALAAVEEFDLADDLDKLPSELPYGRRRLVAIARAIAMEPSVLLLDEPAAGLSAAETAELADLVRRLADRWGFAILLIEHDMTFVMSVCDSLTVLEFGRQIASGSVDEVRNDPVVRKAYLGGEGEHDVPDTISAAALEAGTATSEASR
jgi:ABC-type branched-subunit amino acid transport system ATPase component